VFTPDREEITAGMTRDYFRAGKQRAEFAADHVPAPAIRVYRRLDADAVPRYLEMSVENLTREQARFSRKIGRPSVAAHNLLKTVRRNMEMFERAFTMFLLSHRRTRQCRQPTPNGGGRRNIDELKKQVSEMQKRLDRLISGFRDKS